MPLDQVIGMGGLALIAAAFGTLLLPLGVCEQGPHCQEIQRLEDAEQRHLQDEYARRCHLKPREDED
jgi:hypothetical protein